MLDLFTKPEGEEGALGPILGVLAGVVVSSGFWVLSSRLELFSPMWTNIGAVVAFIIVAYNVRLAMVKKPKEPEDQPEDQPEEETTSQPE